MEVLLEKLAEVMGATLHLKQGQPVTPISGIKPLDTAQPGDLTFLANAIYKSQMQHTRATAVVLASNDLAACPVHALVVDNPLLGLARSTELFDLTPKESAGFLHDSVVIGQDCDIDESVGIGANVVIGNHVRIAKGVTIGAGCVVSDYCVLGENTQLKANVTLDHHVVLGKNVIIHSGAVIGSDGFGNVRHEGRWLKIPQIGGVRIGDDVEVGANSTIDRGALGDTVIEQGVRIDNLVQIAHNVVVGAGTAIAAGSGIAGSAKIGKNCLIAGIVGVNGHVSIADNSIVTAMSGVTHSLNKPGMYSGFPAYENTRWRRSVARVKQLDKMAKRIKALESTLKERGEHS